MLIHYEDYLNVSSLQDEIKKYSYFEYDVNEVLHISPNEEKKLENYFMKLTLSRLTIKMNLVEKLFYPIFSRY